LKYIEIIDALVRLGGERLCEITPFRTWLLWIFLPTKIVRKGFDPSAFKSPWLLLDLSFVAHTGLCQK
jgi:hypothetical protein